MTPPNWLWSKARPALNIARIVVAFLSLGTIHLYGFVEGLGGYSYPILSTSLVTRVWWHFTTSLLNTAIISSFVVLIYATSTAAMRASMSLIDLSKDFGEGFPDVMWSMLATLSLLIWSNQYRVNWSEVLGTLAWFAIPVALTGLTSLVVWRRNGNLKKYFERIVGEFHRLPTDVVFSSAAVFVLLGLSYTLGKGLSVSVIESQNTVVEFVDAANGFAVGSLIDFNSSGIVFFERGKTSFPVFIPMDEIRRIEFGFSL